MRTRSEFGSAVQNSLLHRERTRKGTVHRPGSSWFPWAKMNGSGAWLGRLGSALALLGLSSLAACGARTAEAAFATDFNCNTGVSAESTNALGRYRVKGCGREATYQCVGTSELVCAIQTVDEGTASSLDDGSPPEPRRIGTRRASSVEVNTKGDEAVMLLELVLDGKALLRMTATPDKRADVVQFKIVREEPDKAADECNLDFMVNGQIIKTPQAVAARKGDVLSHRVQVGRELITEFAIAEKVALRVCKDRWGLSREQVQKVRDFMERFQEEMAWKGTPRDGSTGGLLAPNGGWPAWSGNAKPPAAFEGPALEARAVQKTRPVGVQARGESQHWSRARLRRGGEHDRARDQLPRGAGSAQARAPARQGRVARAHRPRRPSH